MSAESVTIEVRCSKTGRVMRVGFARISPEEPFEVEAVVPGSGVSTSVGGTRLPSGDGKPPGKSLYVDTTSRHRDAMEFDWTMFHCIHCDEETTRAGILECGSCEALICSGTLREKRGGRFTYSCAVCGTKASGRRFGAIESFSARPGHAAPSALGEGKRGLLEQARGLLPGGKKEQ